VPPWRRADRCRERLPGTCLPPDRADLASPLTAPPPSLLPAHARPRSAYFALPFIPDPRAHDSFAPLFEDAWVLDLRAQLASFLASALSQVDARPPTLYRVFRAAHAHVRGGSTSSAASAASSARSGHAASVASSSGASPPASPASPGLRARDELVSDTASSARSLGVAAGRVLRACRRAVADADAKGADAVAVAAVGTLRRAGDILASAIQEARPAILRAEAVVGRSRGRGGDWDDSSKPASTVSSAAGGNRSRGRPGGAEDRGAPAGADGAWRWDGEGGDGAEGGSGAGFGRTRLRLEGRVTGGPAVPPWHARGSLPPLSWGRVRRDLSRYAVAAASGSVHSGRRCCLLLQALRWRVTRTRPGGARRALLREWAAGDALGVHTAGQPRRSERRPDAEAAAVGSPDGAGAAPSAGAPGGGAEDREAASRAAPAAAVRGQLGPLVVRLLRCPAPAVSEGACRCVNAVSSEAVGRAYVTRAPGLVPALLSVLRGEAGDTPARQNALGALQKCSLRRSAQRDMIEGGALEWATAALAGHSRWRRARAARRQSMGTAGVAALAEAEADAARFRLAPYSVEYAAALVMNLSLRGSGRRRAAAMAEDEDGEQPVLRLLRDSLVTGLLGRAPGQDGKDADDDDDDDGADEEEEAPAEQVRTYLNGALYSLLTSAPLLERARAEGLDRVVEGAMGSAREQHRRHLEFILEQVRSGAAADDDDDEEEEDDDDDDDDDADAAEDDDALGADEDLDAEEEGEEDGDVDDALVPEEDEGEHAGEGLLAAGYSVAAVSRRALAQQGSGDDADGDGAGAGAPALRPVTPGARRGQPPLPAELEPRPRILRTPPGIARGRLMAAIDETGLSHGSVLDGGGTTAGRRPGRGTSEASSGDSSPARHAPAVRGEWGADGRLDERDEYDDDRDDDGLAPAGTLPPDTPSTLPIGGLLAGDDSTLGSPRPGFRDDDLDDAPPRATPARAPPRVDPPAEDVTDEAPAEHVFAARPRILRSPSSSPGGPLF